MLHPIILYEIAKARYYEMLQAAERYRQARKLNARRAYGLPIIMSNSFAGQKPEAKTVLSILTR
jgi:hypothetical protein